MAFPIGGIIGTLGAIAGGVQAAETIARGVGRIADIARGGAVATATVPSAGGTEFARVGVERNGIAATARFGPSPARLPFPLPRIPPPLPIPVPLPREARPRSRLQELLDRARMNTGQAVTSRRIRDFVRTCGLELAADFFGLREVEICEIVVSTRRRRARGISASDLRRCRATIRKMNSFQRQLKGLRRR